MKRNVSLLLAGVVAALSLSSCALLTEIAPTPTPTAQVVSYDLATGPPYTDQPYVVLQDNVPNFDSSDFTTQAFETYAPLDDLDRCGVAYANICTELMPTEERGSIGQVKPSGWHTVTYDNVDGRYLYNRCHLIGFQLAGENANEQNLITGTRYMNVEGMLPFENQVADYVEETENHVLYRVTPIFQGDNLVASGVQMEAWSVEDQGEGVCFNVYVYNVQPGITIDYATGESWTSEVTATHYVLNTSSKKFHLPECSGVRDMNGSNRQDYQGSREQLLKQGYTPCGLCNP